MGKDPDNANQINYLPTQGAFAKQMRKRNVIANAFWGRWKDEYIQKLLPYSKWLESHRNMEKGDIVLIKENYSSFVVNPYSEYLWEINPPPPKVA